MAKIVKPRWLPALFACFVSTVFVAYRPTPPNDGDSLSPASSADVVFRHYL